MKSVSISIREQSVPGIFYPHSIFLCFSENGHQTVEYMSLHTECLWFNNLAKLHLFEAIISQLSKFIPQHLST